MDPPVMLPIFVAPPICKMLCCRRKIIKPKERKPDL